MKKSRQIAHNFLLYSIFIFYMMIVFAIVFRTKRLTREMNLIPFHTIINFLSRDIFHSFVLMNLLGNIVLFVPLGIYSALFTQHEKIGKNVFIVFLTSLAIEIVQYVFKLGFGDVDDVILNTFGGYVGVMSYRFLLQKLKDEGKIKNVVEIISLIVAIVSMVAFMFIKI